MDQEQRHLEHLQAIYLANLRKQEERIANAGGPDAAPVALVNEAEATRAMIAELQIKLAPARGSYLELEAMGGAGRTQVILGLLRAQDRRFAEFAAEQRRKENWLIVILIIFAVVAVAALVVGIVALERTLEGFGGSGTLISVLMNILRWRLALCPIADACWP